MPEFDFFFPPGFYLLISIAYLSSQWFGQVYLLSSINQSMVALYCKSHLGKSNCSWKSHYLKAFVEVMVTAQLLYFVFWKEEVQLLQSCHPIYVSTILFTLHLFGSARKTKKDLVYTGTCLLNFPLHDLDPSEGSKQEWIVYVSYITCKPWIFFCMHFYSSVPNIFF